MHLSNSNNNINSNNSKAYLNNEQIDKLKHVLDRSISIYSSSSSSLPTLNLIPRQFLRQLAFKLKEHSVDITSIRLNGGAASYVLVDDPNFHYRDIDILISIQTPLSSEKKTTLFSSNNQSYSCDVWTIVKYIICSCLLEHIHNATSTDPTAQQYTHNYISNVLDTYATKNIKISSEQDSWALLSLQNYSGQNLELKFVENLKRQWQFSVDSFQINLEPLLFETKSYNRLLCKCPSISSITKTIKTKNLVIDAINGLTIIKKDLEDKTTNDEQPTKTSQDKAQALTSASPLQFGFFTPSSSPDTINQENNIECQTLATITTISTTNSNDSIIEYRSRLSKSSISTISEEPISSSLQFHLSLNEDTDDGIVSDVDDSVTEDDDQVFQTPVHTTSAPASPATLIASDSSTNALVIEVFSVYKDVYQALEHLNKKLIVTYAPETMRGGGLLKYCDLLAQSYKVHDLTEMFRMERYMCSRFFIDYKTVPEQRHVISQYVATHFLPTSVINSTEQSNSSRQTNTKTSFDENNLSNARLCLLFFDHLYNVIHQSTVCLTHHDKQLTLITVNQLKDFYHFNYKHLFINENHSQQRYQVYHHHYHHHNHHHCSSSSSNSSRSSSPSSSSSNSHRYFRQNTNHRYYQSSYRNHHRQSTNSSFYHHNQTSRNQSYVTNSYQRRV